jgi:predicted nucleotide-binding protein
MAPTTTRLRGRDSTPSSRAQVNIQATACTPGIIISMPVLHIPLPQADEQLTERITRGQALLDKPYGFLSLEAPVGDLEEERWKQALRWHDYNCSWLLNNLGDEVREEYQAVAGRAYHAGIPAFGRVKDTLQVALPEEISKLESIRERLPLWASEPAALPGSHTARLLPDSPIFIVHGSDTLRAESVARTVTRATGRETVILRDQPNLGRTIIEKFEQHAGEVSYAIIVLTADDKGSRADEAMARPRGRQNVIFEMGYFYGLIGRDRVSVLLRPGVEKPSDMDGIAYITYDDNSAWATELFRELRHAGFDINL